MSAITDSELTAIEERAAKATEGPWKFEPGSFTKGSAHVLHAATGEGEHWTKRTIAISHFFYAGDVPDWSFIAHARTDVPRLCRAVREAREEIVKYTDGYRHEQHVAGEYQRMYAETCTERDAALAEVERLKALLGEQTALLGRAHGAITRCERTSSGREAAKVLDDIDALFARAALAGKAGE